ncbi:MAG: diguanylate cyclase [Eubacteriales bacterium]|nr:diguanylate cyclase [Eubacteriales bacterium]
MHNTPAVLYAQINLFCMSILSLMLCRALRGGDRRYAWKLFTLTIGAALLFLFSDVLWGFIQSGDLSVPLWAAYLVNAVYFIGSGAVAYLWFLYTEAVQGSQFLKKRRNRVWGVLPFAALVVLVIVSCKTGWMFFIDAQTGYHRGLWHPAHWALSYSYVLIASVKTLCKGLKKENYARREKFLTLASFAVPPLVFSALQLFFEGLPLLGMGITLALLLIYLNAQEVQISVDPFTRLNNRNQMMRYLSGRIKHADENLCLLMMDVDHFKQVNDRYGHLGGDEILLQVAGALKKVCEKYNCFVARYGGDEFVMIYEETPEKDVESLCQCIHDTLKQEAGTCPVTISVGYAHWQADMRYVQELIACADERLYRAQRKRPTEKQP